MGLIGFAKSALFQKNLNNPDINVRKKALQSLGQLSCDSSIPPIIKALKDSNSDIRMDAAKYLGFKGHKSAVAPLCHCLKDKDFKVRNAVVDSLCILGDNSICPELFKLILNDEKTIRTSIIKFIDKFNWRPDSIDDNVRYLLAGQQIDKICEIGSAVVDILIKLKTGDCNLRLVIVEALGRIQDKKCLIGLKKALYDPYWKVRDASVKFIGNYRDVSNFDLLMKIFLSEQEDKKIISSSYDSLCQLEKTPELLKKLVNTINEYCLKIDKISTFVKILSGAESETLIIPLLELLTDEKWEIRFFVLNILQEISFSRVMGPILKVFDDPVSAVRIKALEVFLPSGDRRVIEKVVEAILDDDNIVVTWAENILKVIDNQISINYLVDKFISLSDINLKKKIGNILLEIGPKSCISLHENLTDATNDLKIQIIKLLGKIGDSSSIEIIKPYMESQDSLLVMTATSAINRIKSI
ncbi:HEAT repeat domain-containing protein [bacterium]|nr:HEAT repeat domain-containing protein [bacterium]